MAGETGFQTRSHMSRNQTVIWIVSGNGIRLRSTKTNEKCRMKITRKISYTRQLSINTLDEVDLAFTLPIPFPLFYWGRLLIIGKL
jgi:hypothetical protein